MSDAALARSIIEEAFGLEPGNRSRVIAAAFELLKELERSIPKQVLRDRRSEWTERRVRSIVDREATRVDNYEIEDLRRAAREQARRELQRSRERASRMAAFLAAQDPDFHGDEIERMGSFARGVDMPRVVRGGGRR